MRHLHQIRLYFIKCFSCSGTTTDKDISIELESPEIQRHLHILDVYKRQYDDYLIITRQEYAAHLHLAEEGFTGTRHSENESICLKESQMADR